MPSLKALDVGIRALFIVVAIVLLSACAKAPRLGVAPSTLAVDTVDETDLSARGPRYVKASNPTPDGPDGSASAARLYPGQEAATVKQPTTGQFSGVRPAGDGYELNFENANLADAVKVILGDTLRKSYVFDPKLQGQVTLSTGRPISESELLSILEIVLQINNAAMVLNEGKYQIIASEKATKGTKRLVGLAAPGTANRPGYGVSVLPLRHVSAKQMLGLLDGFLSRSGSVRADVSRNLLLLRGNGQERRTLLDVAMSFDLDWLKGRAAGIFPLSFATAAEVILELKKILESDEGGRGHGTVKFEAIERLNAVLVLTNRNKRLRAVATWIKRLDRSNSNGVNVYVYNVQHSKAEPLAKILNATFSESVSADPDADKAKGKASAPKQSDGDDGFNSDSDTADSDKDSSSESSSGQESEGEAKSGQSTTVGSAAETASSSPQGKTNDRPHDVRVVADKANNTLLIRARPRDYRRVLTALRGIDRPPLQIMINATIAEVTLNDSLRYGVQAFLRGNRASVNLADVAGLPLQQTFPGLNFVLGSSANPKVVLDALSNVTNVQVVSSPSLVVLDNQEAKLKVGSEVPVVTQQSTSSVTADPRIVNAITFRDTGVILKVTPRVSSNGLVTMEVRQEVSAVAPSANPESLTPTINQRQINSTIAVYSGQTVVLGGLISEEDSREKDRVPLVQKLPIIGDLLGKTENTRVRRELIVFIRPRVIRDGHDASMAAQELANRLRLVAPAPGHYEHVPIKRRASLK